MNRHHSQFISQLKTNKKPLPQFTRPTPAREMDMTGKWIALLDLDPNATVFANEERTLLVKSPLDEKVLSIFEVEDKVEWTMKKCVEETNKKLKPMWASMLQNLQNTVKTRYHPPLRTPSRLLEKIESSFTSSVRSSSIPQKKQKESSSFEINEKPLSFTKSLCLMEQDQPPGKSGKTQIKEKSEGEKGERRRSQSEQRAQKTQNGSQINEKMTKFQDNMGMLPPLSHHQKIVYVQKSKNSWILQPKTIPINPKGSQWRKERAKTNSPKRISQKLYLLPVK